MGNMSKEEFEKMLNRGYMTDEEFESIRRDGEEAWDEWEASRAEEGERKCPKCGSYLQSSVEDCYRFSSCKCGYEDFGWA